MTAPACASPLDLSVLVDYWLSDGESGEQERIEEHLLGCASCSERLRDLLDVADGIRTLTKRGVVRAVVTSAVVEHLVREGLRVREYRVSSGGSVQCTVTAADDLVVARLAAELRGVTRIDLAMCDPDGREKDRLRDVPVSAFAREIVLLERIDRLRALPASVNCVRLIAVDEQGERLLGEYTFVHTPAARG